MREIAGKTVFITGASAGVGLACAQRFLQLGANVVMCARDAARLQRAAAALRADERLLVLAWDVADTQRADEMFARTVERFGALHVLVNNAGCNVRGELLDLDAEAIQRIIDVNFRAPLLLSRAALPHLKRSGSAAIVNVASLAGRIPLAHEAVYSATKFGLRAFSLALADELSGSDISVSVVSPGPISTGFILEALDDVPDLVFSQPMSSAEEVAGEVIACVRDGRPERALPALSGWLCNLGYLFPWLARALRPAMVRRGKRAKALWRARGSGA